MGGLRRRDVPEGLKLDNVLGDDGGKPQPFLARRLLCIDGLLLAPRGGHLASLGGLRCHSVGTFAGHLSRMEEGGRDWELSWCSLSWALELKDDKGKGGMRCVKLNQPCLVASYSQGNASRAHHVAVILWFPHASCV